MGDLGQLVDPLAAQVVFIGAEVVVDRTGSLDFYDAVRKTINELTVVRDEYQPASEDLLFAAPRWTIAGHSDGKSAEMS